MILTGIFLKVFDNESSSFTHFDKKFVRSLNEETIIHGINLNVKEK